MVSTNIIILGVGAVAAGYLFLTKDGQALVQDLLDSIGSVGGGGGGGSSDTDEFDVEEALVDYRESIANDPDAFTPGTSRWQEIVRRNRGKAAASELFKKTNRT